MCNHPLIKASRRETPRGWNPARRQPRRAMRPGRDKWGGGHSDLYVKMLNAVDERLSRRGLPTRIVFLIYVDLLWTNRNERIRNPDRCILMFAPITRSYSRSFAAAPDRPRVGPYRRNKLKFPRESGANLTFRESWQCQFRGDNLDFDCHYVWDHYKDPGYYAMALSPPGCPATPPVWPPCNPCRIRS